jgi:hypothetical protein
MQQKFLRIGTNMFGKFRKREVNFIVASTKTKIKLGDEVWIIEVDEKSHVPTGSLITTIVRNEVYLNDYHYLTPGYRIIAFDIIEVVEAGIRTLNDILAIDYL